VEKKFRSFSSISAGVCWGIWLTRNDMIFRGSFWQDIKVVVRRIWKLMLTRKPIFSEETEGDINLWCSFMEEVLKTPMAIASS
jgi:hypothetical protein